MLKASGVWGGPNCRCRVWGTPRTRVTHGWLHGYENQKQMQHSGSAHSKTVQLMWMWWALIIIFLIIPFIRSFFPPLIRSLKHSFIHTFSRSSLSISNQVNCRIKNGERGIALRRESIWSLETSGVTTHSECRLKTRAGNSHLPPQTRRDRIIWALWMASAHVWMQIRVNMLDVRQRKRVTGREERKGIGSGGMEIKERKKDAEWQIEQ